MKKSEFKKGVKIYKSHLLKKRVYIRDLCQRIKPLSSNHRNHRGNREKRRGFKFIICTLNKLILFFRTFKHHKNDCQKQNI